MKIVVLCENTSNRKGIGCEHGLSLWCESQGRKFLFDAGQTSLFAENAAAKGVNLKEAEFAVLSHGHYDHGGGIFEFMRLNSHAPIYVNENAFGEFYNASGKFIGLDSDLRQSPRLIFTQNEYEIAEGLRLFTCNGEHLKYPVRSLSLTVRRGGAAQEDDFLHEQYLLVQEGSKRILLSGCSHKGVLNLVERFQPDILVGGFHFNKFDVNGKDAKFLDEAADYLLSRKSLYYTCHCTGVPQYEYLRRRMGERIGYLSSGDCLEI